MRARAPVSANNLHPLNDCPSPFARAAWLTFLLTAALALTGCDSAEDSGEPLTPDALAGTYSDGRFSGRTGSLFSVVCLTYRLEQQG